MQMAKLTAPATSALLAMLVLTGCGGGSVEEFCELENLSGASGSEVTSDEFADQFDELVDAAPEEIRADMEALRDYLEDPEGGDPEALGEASSNIQAFVVENCS